MMKITKTIVLALLLLNSALVYSANQTVTGKLTTFSVYRAGLFVQLDSSNLANPGACSNSGFYFLPIQERFMTEVLHQAKISFSSVSITISDKLCQVGWPQVISVRLL